MAYGLTNSADIENTGGADQYFSRADTTSLSITGDISVEGWFKIESAPTFFFLAAKRDGTSINNGGWQWLSNGTNFQFDVVSSLGALGRCTGSVAVADYVGTWVHLAATWDAGLVAPILYVNGVVDTASATSALATDIDDNNNAIVLGREGEKDDGYYDGRMSLVRIWNDVRTQAEIADNMCVYFGTAEAGMAAEWALDDVLGGSGLNDTSGNTNTLTNNNSITFGADTPATCSAAAAAGSIRRRMMIGIGK